MTEFRNVVSELKVKPVRFIPGEHDASLDDGKAFKEFFGPPHYTFEHKGVHFIVLDNVSDPGAKLGDEQLAWLADDLKKQPPGRTDRRVRAPPAVRPVPAVGLGHARRCQGGRAADAASQRDRVLRPHPPGTPSDDRAHPRRWAKSLIFPLPPAGSQPKRAPLPWDPAQPYQGLGFRQVAAETRKAEYVITEMPVQRA